MLEISLYDCTAVSVAALKHFSILTTLRCTLCTVTDLEQLPAVIREALLQLHTLKLYSIELQGNQGISAWVDFVFDRPSGWRLRHPAVRAGGRQQPVPVLLYRYPPSGVAAFSLYYVLQHKSWLRR